MDKKYLRLDRDVDTDLRVVRLMESTGQGVAECLGVAVTIWMSGPEKPPRVPEWATPEALIESGLVDETGPIPYRDRSAYKRDWARKRRSVDSLCPQMESVSADNLRVESEPVDSSSPHVDSMCPQRGQFVSTEQDEESGDVVRKSSKQKTKRESRKKLVKKTENSASSIFNVSRKNSDYTHNLDYYKSIRITTNKEKEKRNKKQKESEAPDATDIVWQDVLSGQIDQTPSDKISLPTVRRCAAEYYFHIFGVRISPNSKEVRTCIKQLVCDEGRMPSEILKAIKGISKDTWDQRKKHRSFKYIVKSFDTWLDLYAQSDDVLSSGVGTYGPWRDEGYATKDEWMAGDQEITIE